MRIIADFHLHSKYSRATSRDMDIPHIVQWAKYKGIDLIGTGDFTHPFWQAEIKSKLKEDGSGILKTKDSSKTNFILTTELSSIYTQDAKVRKVHTLIFVPDLETVKAITDKLTGIGNLYSDGRPILGLSAKELLKIVLDINPEALVIPAHAWTPWFSIFGSNSGFDSIKECFGELAPNIYCFETGLSSDPEMNWRLSALDKIALISNSDAHNPTNLGREANVFDIPGELTFAKITEAIKSKNPQEFLYTIEFFPEEGKYHFDGHRACGIVLDPIKTCFPDNLCPVCKRKLTIGVMRRVEELADRRSDFRPENFPGAKHLIPLVEIIAEDLGVQGKTKKVEEEYFSLIRRFGSEFKILLDASIEEIAQYNAKIAQGIANMRAGKVLKEAGYDGVYGKIKVFAGEDASVSQNTLF